MRCPAYVAVQSPEGLRAERCPMDAGHEGGCDGTPSVHIRGSAGGWESAQVVGDLLVVRMAPADVAATWSREEWLEALEAGRAAGTVAPVKAITTGLSYAMAEGRL